MQRFGERRVITAQIVAGQQAADAVEIAGKLTSDIAAIKIVESDMGELRQRFRKRRLLERRADIRRLAINKEGAGEAGRVFQAAKCSRVSLAWLRVTR